MLGELNESVTKEQTSSYKINIGEVTYNTVRQGCILSPCLFHLYVEYIMRNPGLDEAQAVIKIAWRIVNNLSYVDDTLMSESGQKKNK